MVIGVEDPREKQRLKEKYTRLVKSVDIIDEGVKASKVWTGWAFRKPPTNPLEFLVWVYVTLQQLALSSITFPAALAAFLLEEAAQTIGMGAYILWTAKDYETLDSYLDMQATHLDALSSATIPLAVLNPITGGSVTIYMDSAKISQQAFRKALDKKLLEQAETDEKLRQKLIDATKYGRLRLQSSPTGANIFMNGEDLKLLTPETFKELEAGAYTFLLKKYSAARDIEETVEFTVTIEAGRKKEIFARIPKIIDGVPEEEVPPGETDEPQLPDFIKAEVTGEYAIDGDTFITTTGERIRVLGIDAPEIGRPWSEESREALTILVEDKKISLRIQSHKPLDQYGRTLAICSSWKGDIAIFQLSSGLARVAYFEDDIFDYTKYYTAETIAKDRGIGIWS